MDSQQRIYFSSLRSNFLRSGRITALYGMPFAGAINLGYAIESYFKQGLLETGFNKKSIQYSHDLKLLYHACRENGIYADVSVSEDFLDYANSLFQMRYPISTIEEGRKATARNNVLGMSWDFLLAYDDFLLQLDLALLSYTNDRYSSSINIICADADQPKSHLFLYQNIFTLDKLQTFISILEQYYPNNTDALAALLDRNKFWTANEVSPIFYIDYDTALNQYANAAKNFVFPGNVRRDSEGNVIAFEF